MVADVVAVLAGATMATLLQWGFRPQPEFVVRDHFWILVLSVPLFVVGAVVFGLYRADANERRWEERVKIVKTVLVFVGGMIALAFFSQYDFLSRFWVIALAVCTTLALFLERELARRTSTFTPV
jgi:hypothetical protein